MRCGPKQVADPGGKSFTMFRREHSLNLYKARLVLPRAKRYSTEMVVATMALHTHKYMIDRLC
jgi:hypothetical protein